MNINEYINSLKTDQLNQVNEYREHLYRYPRLRRLFFELTQRCNENCFHCGSRCGARGEDGIPKELFMEVLRDVKANFDISDIQLCITGGEPLLYADFFDLMAYASEEGFSWGMTSNATLITKDIARKLREVRMGTISVSIDGLPRTHDLLRGRKGSWDMAMRGIKNLIEEDYFQEIQVTSVINHENIEELDDLFEVLDKSGIDSWRVIGLEPIGRALEYPDRMLTKEDHARLFSFIRQKREQRIPVTYGCSHYLGLDLEREVRDWYFLCDAGVRTAGITHTGDICACLDVERRAETIQGNIKEDRFSDIWRDGFQFFRRRLSVDNEKCRTCPSEEYCAGGSFHSWDFDKNEQRICMKDLL